MLSDSESHSEPRELRQPTCLDENSPEAIALFNPLHLIPPSTALNFASVETLSEIVLSQLSIMPPPTPQFEHYALCDALSICDPISQPLDQQFGHDFALFDRDSRALTRSSSDMVMADWEGLADKAPKPSFYTMTDSKLFDSSYAIDAMNPAVLHDHASISTVSETPMLDPSSTSTLNWTPTFTPGSSTQVSPLFSDVGEDEFMHLSCSNVDAMFPPLPGPPALRPTKLQDLDTSSQPPSQRRASSIVSAHTHGHAQAHAQFSPLSSFSKCAKPNKVTKQRAKKDLSKIDATNDKEVKTAKNTLAARYSRAKKAAEYEAAQQRIAELEAENCALKAEMQRYRSRAGGNCVVALDDEWKLDLG